MFPSQVLLDMHRAESQLARADREHVRDVFALKYELCGQQYDLSHAAFSPWRTAAQMAFAVGFTILGLALVLVSIVAISRA